MRRPVSWCQMRVRSWIESIGVSDCTPSSVSIQRRLRLSRMWTSWPRSERCSAVGQPHEAVAAENRDLHGPAPSACLPRPIPVICDSLPTPRALPRLVPTPRRSAAALATAAAPPAAPARRGGSGGRDEAGGDDQLRRVLDRHVERDARRARHEEQEARGRVRRRGQEDADQVRLADLRRDLAARSRWRRRRSPRDPCAGTRPGRPAGTRCSTG